MAEQSGFFNSNMVNGEYDRVYLAEHFAKYFSSFIGNGVFGGKSSELIVSQPVESGMKIEILSGMAWINGFWYENTSNLSLDVQVADGVLNRIDNVVIKFGRVERKIWAEIVKGTPATNAIAPQVSRNTDYYELKIAEIYIKAGATKITQADITDTRLDSSVCGLVKGIIEQIDTTEFGRQLNGYISKYAAEYKDYLESFEASSTNEIQRIIARLNELIRDESALAGLALDVNDLENEVALVNQTMGYFKKNLIPYPFVNSVGDIAEFAGITWTDLGDGTIKGNGTATENSYFTFYEGNIYLKPGKYKLTSGFNDNESIYVFFVKVKKSDGVSYDGRVRSTENVAIEITQTDLEEYDILISAFATKGASLSNIIMKPMLRKVEILDSTWEPYRLSVAEMIQEDEIEKGCFYRIDRFTGVKTWINPPNKPGVEYCTTEMWDNKPVYQMTFYVASLPVNSVMSIASNSEWDKVVSVNGYAHDADDLTFYPFPIILHSQTTPIAVISRVESDGHIVITTNGDASYFRAYITIKYTK